MPKPNQNAQFQFQQEVEQPPSFKEKWLPRIRYVGYVALVLCVWLTIIGFVYWTFDQAGRHIKLVEDAP